MKKALSLILVAGVFFAMVTLAACGDNTVEDMSSLAEENTTLLSDISEDLSEDLSEALTDEQTTEETTDETTEQEESTEETRLDETTEQGILAE